MSDVTTQCADCAAVLEEPVELPLVDRPECPECGSTKRTFQVSDSAPTGVGIHVPGQGIVVKVGTAIEHEIAQPVTPRVGDPDGTIALPVENLPTEVIVDAMDVGITLLAPHPEELDGQWVAEVGLSNYRVPLGVGTLPDILLAAAEWLERLATYWQEKRRGED